MVTPARLGARFVAALTAIIVMVVASTPLVSAELVPGPGVGVQSSPPTSTVELIGIGPGQGVNGFMSTLTPAERLNGYPTAVQPSWPAHNVGFAGLIQMKVTSGPGAGFTFFAYCVDLLTPTNVGFDYKRGEWNEANIANVGYVAQLLQSYSPNTGEPSGLQPNPRAAAVQAAIWYLSDGYVLSPSAGLYATVRDIVADVIRRGPLTAPPPPTLTVSGPPAGRANTVVGPFVVNTSGQQAVGRVPAGVTAFADAAGASPLPATFPVTNGQQIWLRSAQVGLENPALTVTAIATQPGGAVYLYVPGPGQPAGAQTIIQAGPLTAETDVDTPVVFFDIGQFTITKTITGEGSGLQGPIQIDIVCSVPNSTIPPFTIPGGAPAGAVTTVVTGITVPARCHVTETASGDTEIVDVYAEPAAATARAIAPRRVALHSAQQVSVCPETATAQPFAGSVGGELQAAPGANFENHIETTTTTAASTTTSTTTSTSSTDSTTSTTTSTSSTDATTSTSSTSPTTPTTPTTGPTTTGATTTTATTTIATTAGATTTVATTTTGATTTAATTTVVPTTAPNECELSGDTTTTAAVGPDTLPATGSSGSGPLVVGVIGVVAGLGLVALASRRRFLE